MMDEPKKVTAILKVEAEFYDDEATPETVRYAVEQTLEDAGFDVEVINLSKPIKIAYEGPTGIYTNLSGQNNNTFSKWIPVEERMPEGAGYACLVCAVNRFGQQDVFEAFTGYGDFKWYTYDATKMKYPSRNNEVSEAWKITHWMEKPLPPEEDT